MSSLTVHIDSWGEYPISTVDNNLKNKIISLFLEKYGKSQVYNSKDFIWAFPSIEKPKYTCRLDTTRMTVTYSYNPLFLIPFIEREEKNEKIRMKEEREKIKEAI